MLLLDSFYVFTKKFPNATTEILRSVSYTEMAQINISGKF